MLTDEQRATLEALSDEELEFEFARGSASRFQREKFDHLKVVWGQRQQASADAAQAAALKAAQDGVAATRSGTQWATAGWIVAGVIAVAGIVTTALLSK
jgi:hypothetical protein